MHALHGNGFDISDVFLLVIIAALGYRLAVIGVHLLTACQRATDVLIRPAVTAATTYSIIDAITRLVPPPSTTRAALTYKKNPPPQKTVTDHHGRDKPAGHHPPRPGRGTSSPSPRAPSYVLHANSDPPDAAPVFPHKLSFPGDIPTSPQSATPPAQPKHVHPQSIPLPRTCRAPTSFRPHRSRLRQCLAFALLHPGACGAIPLLHVPAAISADFRLIVDTGSPENIHNNAADLFDTAPSDKVFITADGTRVLAMCVVGNLPLILTDTSGCQSFFILHEVHAVPSFEYTLLSVANLVSQQRRLRPDQLGLRVHCPPRCKPVYRRAHYPSPQSGGWPLPRRRCNRRRVRRPQTWHPRPRCLPRSAHLSTSRGAPCGRTCHCHIPSPGLRRRETPPSRRHCVRRAPRHRPWHPPPRARVGHCQC